MRRWWAKKYRRSPKSADFLGYTLWDLLVEFFEDYYGEDKKRMWKDEREETGHIRLPKTGDPLIDRWEEQLAQGVEPDLTEGMLPEERAKVKSKMRQIVDADKQRREELESRQTDQFFQGGNDIATAYLAEFDDDYTQQGDQ